MVILYIWNAFGIQPGAQAFAEGDYKAPNNVFERM